jgi:hypothetical protein
MTVLGFGKFRLLDTALIAASFATGGCNEPFCGSNVITFAGTLFVGLRVRHRNETRRVAG